MYEQNQRRNYIGIQRINLYFFKHRYRDYTSTDMISYHKPYTK